MVADHDPRTRATRWTRRRPASPTTPDQRAEYARLADRVDEVLVAAMADASAPAFAVAGALALPAAALLLAAARPPRGGWLPSGALLALALPAAMALAPPRSRRARDPRRPVIAVLNSECRHAH